MEPQFGFYVHVQYVPEYQFKQFSIHSHVFYLHCIAHLSSGRSIC